MTGFHREQHVMTRVEIATGMPFDEFVAKLEEAAPPVDRAAMERIIAAGGNWDDVRAAVAKNAPNELMVYAKVGGTAPHVRHRHFTPWVEAHCPQWRLAGTTRGPGSERASADFFVYECS